MARPPPPHNPFTYNQIVGGPRFVNRDTEITTLLRHGENGVNVLLVAPRRFGKSSLILETFRRAEPDTLCVYVDLYGCLDVQEAASNILTALARAAYGRFQRLFDALIERLRALAVQVILDNDGPRLVIGPGIEPGHAMEEALHAMEEAAKRKGRRVLVALDEFQALMDLDPHDKILAKMRSVIQRQEHVSYILSGSKKHVLLRLVQEPDHPFWAQLELIELGPLSGHHLATYAADAFAKSDRTMAPGTLERIDQLAQGNPKRMQELLHVLWDSPDPPGPATVDRLFDERIGANAHLFRGFLDQVRAHNQRRLLKGLAVRGTAKGMLSGAFVQEFGLTTPANVQYAARRLREAGILDDHNHFTDPFLYHYLRRLYHAPPPAAYGEDGDAADDPARPA